MLRVDTLLSGALVNGGGINQLYFANPGSEASACAAAVQDFWDALAVAMSEEVTYEVLGTVTEQDHATGALEAVYAVMSEGPKVGVGTSEPAPPTTQGLIRMVTPMVANGRIVRGRVFVPGVLEVHVGPVGRPVSAYNTVLNGAAQALVDDASAFWSVWHRPNAASGSPGTINNIVQVTSWDQFAVLRSRRD